MFPELTPKYRYSQCSNDTKFINYGGYWERLEPLKWYSSIWWRTRRNIRRWVIFILVVGQKVVSLYREQFSNRRVFSWRILMSVLNLTHCNHQQIIFCHLMTESANLLFKKFAPLLLWRTATGFSVVRENLKKLEKWLFFQKFRENLEKSRKTGEKSAKSGKVGKFFDLDFFLCN